MRYIIWQCPKCKKLRLSQKGRLTGTTRNKVMCNKCQKNLNIRYAIRVFEHADRAEALALYNKLVKEDNLK